MSRKLTFVEMARMNNEGEIVTRTFSPSIDTQILLVVKSAELPCIYLSKLVFGRKYDFPVGSESLTSP